jgi:hypothetical protein
MGWGESPGDEPGARSSGDQAFSKRIQIRAGPSRILTMPSKGIWLVFLGFPWRL